MFVVSFIGDIRRKNDSGSSIENEGLFYAGHPINAYNLIKRWYTMTSFDTPADEQDTDYKQGMVALLFSFKFGSPKLTNPISKLNAKTTCVTLSKLHKFQNQV